MKIQLDSLVITEYCSNNIEKCHFVKDIANDRLTCHFVSKAMDEFFLDSDELEDIYVGASYIVQDDNDLVGFIRLAFVHEDVLNLHYGVHPKFRKNSKHYGARILKETKNCLFEKFNNISEIELYINEINMGSIKCAEEAGYIYRREFSNREGTKFKIYTVRR